MDGHGSRLSDSLLPLITVSHGLSDCRTQAVNAVLDSAAQVSFCTDFIANSLGLETVQNNIQISINGFTGHAESINTRTVKFPVVINSKSSTIICICIPKIQIEILTPKMAELSQKLHTLGVTLAYDPFVEGKLNKVKNLDLLIGVRDWDLTMNLSKYLLGNGETKSSVYYLHNNKIIPVGSISLFLQNLENNKLNISCLATTFGNRENTPLVVDRKISEHAGFQDNSETNISEISKNISLNDNLLNDNISQKKIESHYTSCDSLCNFTTDHDTTNRITNIINTSSCINTEQHSSAVMDLVAFEDLDDKCRQLLNMELSNKRENEILSTETEVTDFILQNSSIKEDGRILIAIPWLSRYKNKLTSNEHLAIQVLKSVKHKYRNDTETLLKTDQVFKSQLQSNIIESIHNMNEFKSKHPKYSFVSHFPLIKSDRKTTKIRVIYMANLAEKSQDGTKGISINQCVHPGFSKNDKIATAFTFTRFDKFLLGFDIQKAYHQLEISEENSAKFLFYWFKNIEKGDFTPVIYKFNRIIFGLACAPFMLSCALHTFLIDVDVMNDLSDLENDKITNLKKRLYAGAYVDNIFVGENSIHDLKETHDASVQIFECSKMPLQQFITNDTAYQNTLNNIHNENSESQTKILGMIWDKNNDTIRAVDYKMSNQAATKRMVLSELQCNYDLIGLQLPIKNRAKLFLRDLHSDSSLDWDTNIGENRIKTWRQIVKQYNRASFHDVPRFVGRRDSMYDLYLFSDASKDFIGMVAYLKDTKTNCVSFLEAHNTLLNTTMRARTTPVLELSAIDFAVEKGLSIYKEFSNNVVPVNINNIFLL